MNVKQRQTYRIHNDGRHKFFFKPEQVVFPESDELSHQLTFVPDDPATVMEGDHIVVRKKQSVRLHVDLIVLKNGFFELVAPFALRFASGPLLLSLGVATVLPSIFGVNPLELESTAVEMRSMAEEEEEKSTATSTCMIPRVLIQMRHYLEEQGGLDVEGIFRIAANETEMPTVRAALNSGTFVSCNDINCISTLIKVFFRQLPRPLLADIPTETILNVKKEADSRAAVQQMSTSAKDLLMWVVDLMCSVVAHGTTNKMTAQSCAIVMGPNLFAAENVSGNPMQALMISQKAVLLLQHLILKKCALTLT